MGNSCRNKRFKCKKGGSSSDEEYLGSGTPVKRRGPGSDNVLQVSDIINRTNSVLYEEDCLVVDQTERNMSDISDKPTLNVKDAKTSQPVSLTNADSLAKLTSIESSIGEMNIKLKTLGSLETKVNEFEKDLKKLWPHVEDKAKVLNDKLDKVDDRVEGLEIAEGLHRDRLRN